MSDDLPEEITLTSQDVAVHHIVEAIHLFRRGRYECAVTLAGAAEGVVPDSGLSSFQRLKTATLPEHLAHTEFAQASPNERGDMLNLLRNRLKHGSKSGSFEIDKRYTEQMIVRAISKLDVRALPDWAAEAWAWFSHHMKSTAAHSL